MFIGAMIYHFVTSEVETPEENERRTLAEIEKLEATLENIRVSTTHHLLHGQPLQSCS